jgi:uncharacterized membrane protein
MTRYKVPQDLNEEEKLIGGVASLRQAAYVILGGGIGLLIAYFVPADMSVKATIFSIPVAAGIALGFLKIKDINLDNYILLRIKFAMSRKAFRYERKERVW